MFLEGLKIGSSGTDNRRLASSAGSGLLDWSYFPAHSETSILQRIQDRVHDGRRRVEVPGGATFWLHSNPPVEMTEAGFAEVNAPPFARGKSEGLVRTYDERTVATPQQPPQPARPHLQREDGSIELKNAKGRETNATVPTRHVRSAPPLHGYTHPPFT